MLYLYLYFGIRSVPVPERISISEIKCAVILLDFYILFFNLNRLVFPLWRLCETFLFFRLLLFLLSFLILRLQIKSLNYWASENNFLFHIRTFWTFFTFHTSILCFCLPEVKRTYLFVLGSGCGRLLHFLSKLWLICVLQLSNLVVHQQQFTWINHQCII